MGKTTNELEKVVNLYAANDNKWADALSDVYSKHLPIINELFDGKGETAAEMVNAIIERVRTFLMQNQTRNYNFIYDQVVSAGEYISTAIVSSYCNSLGITNSLLDAKECIHTDNAYTEGKIDWKKTEKAIVPVITALVKDGFVITQGFIGCTPEGFTTTLGREGSDFTAAIFSYCLDAERMTVWKDVAGVMNADPEGIS
jgi:aspartate kinase